MVTVPETLYHLPATTPGMAACLGRHKHRDTWAVQPEKMEWAAVADPGRSGGQGPVCPAHLLSVLAPELCDRASQTGNR